MTGRILSGVQPTGNLHLGNYLGAIKNWVNLQHDFEPFYCVVDLHAITVPQDPVALRQSTREVTAAFLAAGLDAEKCVIFNQSAVRAHAELMWVFACLTPLGWLNRMTQFKEKVGNKKDQAGLGLYAYPVLMAADILLYRATHVPVGEDQKQHLELARDIAGAFNRQYNTEFFTLPEPQIFGETKRVMSLRDGKNKMSKSDPSDYARINMNDSADEMAQKIKKAKTDPEPLPDHFADDLIDTRPEAANLISIYAALAEKTKQDVCDEFGGKQFSEFKNALTDLVVAVLGPMGEKMRHYLNDPAEIDAVLKRGAEKASGVADETIKQVYDMVGFLKP